MKSSRYGEVRARVCVCVYVGVGCRVEYPKPPSKSPHPDNSPNNWQYGCKTVYRVEYDMLS